MLRPVYTAAVRLLQALALVSPPGDTKLARALRGRRGLIESYTQWAARERDPARQLLWVHAPSVGEALQAQPVMRLMRERDPEIQLAYTYFSPSAEPFASRISADFSAYLPFDHPRDCAAALGALRPAAIVFCKTDVWPNLVATAVEREVPLGLISGTVPAGSMRLRMPAVSLMRSTFARLDRVGAIEQADAERLALMGVAPDRITVTGDTRFDQVLERASRTPPHAVRRLETDRPVIVAGSTWPSDEEVLLPAFRALRRAHPRVRLIIAPHEVTPARVQGLLQAAGNAAALLSGNPADADIVIVDGYGLLGDLYRLATIAFVGGAFHRAGLHSVLEPAAFGTPVVFGPHHRSSRDAQLLLAAGAGRPVARRADLETVLRGWLEQPAERERAGAAALEVVRRGAGAAERSYRLVAELLELSGMARPR